MSINFNITMDTTEIGVQQFFYVPIKTDATCSVYDIIILLILELKFEEKKVPF